MKDAVKDWVVRAEGSRRKLGCLQRNVGTVQHYEDFGQSEKLINKHFLELGPLSLY